MLNKYIPYKGLKIHHSKPYSKLCAATLTKNGRSAARQEKASTSTVQQANSKQVGIHTSATPVVKRGVVLPAAPDQYTSFCQEFKAVIHRQDKSEAARKELCRVINNISASVKDSLGKVIPDQPLTELFSMAIQLLKTLREGDDQAQIADCETMIYWLAKKITNDLRSQSEAGSSKWQKQSLLNVLLPSCSELDLDFYLVDIARLEAIKDLSGGAYTIPSKLYVPLILNAAEIRYGSAVSFINKLLWHYVEYTNTKDILDQFKIVIAVSNLPANSILNTSIQSLVFSVFNDKNFSDLTEEQKDLCFFHAAMFDYYQCFPDYKAEVIRKKLLAYLMQQYPRVEYWCVDFARQHFLKTARRLTVFKTKSCVGISIEAKAFCKRIGLEYVTGVSIGGYPLDVYFLNEKLMIFFDKMNQFIYKDPTDKEWLRYKTESRRSISSEFVTHQLGLLGFKVYRIAEQELQDEKLAACHIKNIEQLIKKEQK